MIHAKYVAGVPASLLALLMLAACPSDDESADAPAPDAQVDPAAAEAALEAGDRTVSGVVSFEGEPPEMTRLRLEADPYCAELEKVSEEVVVNDGKLQNVLVYIDNQDLPVRGADETLVIDQDQCMYRPRVSCAVAGQQTIEIHNSDGTMHNVHTRRGGPRGSTIFNRAQMQGAAPFEETFGDAGSFIHFSCDVHPWMDAFLFLSDNGYCAVTGEDGSFEIPDLPAGEYTLTFWHERFGEQTAEVTVPEDEDATIELAFSEDE